MNIIKTGEPRFGTNGSTLPKAAPRTVYFAEFVRVPETQLGERGLEDGSALVTLLVLQVFIDGGDCIPSGIARQAGGSPPACLPPITSL